MTARKLGGPHLAIFVHHRLAITTTATVFVCLPPVAPGEATTLTTETAHAYLPSNRCTNIDPVLPWLFAKGVLQLEVQESKIFGQGSSFTHKKFSTVFCLQ